MTDMNLAMVLSLKDKMVGPLRQAVEQVEREFVDLERQAKKTGTATSAVADGVAKVGRTAGNAKAVATELRKVGDEASRANRELKNMESTGSRLRSMMSGAAKGVAGVMAFNHVVADPVRRAADYDMELRHLSNTAYAGKPMEQRRAGLGKLNQSITDSVRGAGGNREDALNALKKMIATGAVDSPDAAADLLPVVMKFATAGNASAVDLVEIVKGAKSMGISGKDGITQLFEHSLAAGKAGGFEFNDMSKFLPSQMAAAASIGMTGMKGVDSLLGANQAAYMAAGNAGEAGNNILNLLGKVTSPETINNFKKHGIDLTGSLLKARGEGYDPLNAFNMAVQKVAQSDPRYEALTVAASKATGAEKAQILASQRQLVEGASIGTVIQDRQALMGLLGMLQNGKLLNDVSKATAESKGGGDSDLALIKEGAAFAFDQGNFDNQEAQTRAMSKGNGVLGWAADAKSSLYRNMPDLAATYEGSKVFFQGVGGAIAATGLWNLLAGGGSGTGAASVGSFASKIASTATGAATSATGLASGAVMMAPVLASINPNRDFVGAVADPSVIGSADFASALSDTIAQSKAAADAAKAAAERPLEIKVMLDGQQLEAAVNKQSDIKARRGQ